MNLISLQIKNYKSIVDTGVVELSNHDSITVLAGQNESGKSSILEALNTFETGIFDTDSKPFTTSGSLLQSITCTYSIDSSNFFIEKLTESFFEEFEPEIAEGSPVFDEKKLKFIKSISLTRSKLSDKTESSLEISADIFELIKASILESEEEVEGEMDNGVPKKVIVKKKIIDLELLNNNKVADLIWSYITPKIIFFNDFCDLLPDKMTLADLKTKNTQSKGYRAVKNLEEILKINFVDLYSKDDLERQAIRDEHNDNLSVDFQKAWGQKIHNDNKIEVKYDFEKRDTDDNSYVNFYTETKDRQKLKPHQRSKGLIWFLSFWLELNAQNSDDKQLIILADEPGLYLHVKAQADILKLFKKLSTKGHQIIYTTHSPNLIEAEKLNRIKLVINDPVSGTTLESITTSKIDNKNKQDALQPIANAIGFTVSDFLLSTKKSVILEGISDYFYYLAMRKILERNSEYIFIPGIGVRKQSTLVSFCIGYGIEWLAIFDDDATRGSDAQKTFTDFKNCLFNGDDALSATKMYLTENISSVENMFSIDDIKLVDQSISPKVDTLKSIGEKRKVVFSKLFYEKVEKGEITKERLSKELIENFNKIFDWIDKHFSL